MWQDLVEGDAVDDGTAFKELLGGVDVFVDDDRESTRRVRGQRELIGVVGDSSTGPKRVTDVDNVRCTALEPSVPRRIAVWSRGRVAVLEKDEPLHGEHLGDAQRQRYVGVCKYLVVVSARCSTIARSTEASERFPADPSSNKRTRAASSRVLSASTSRSTARIFCRAVRPAWVNGVEESTVSAEATAATSAADRFNGGRVC